MNKSVLRDEVFKLVYSLMIQKAEPMEQMEVYVEDTEYTESEKNKIKAMAKEILANEEKIKEEISKNLKKGWSLNRVSKINMAVLEVSIYEILFTDTPYKVVINEAVEIAKKYGEEASGSFVNGILAVVVKDNNIA